MYQYLPRLSRKPLSLLPSLELPPGSFLYLKATSFPLWPVSVLAGPGLGEPVHSPGLPHFALWGLDRFQISLCCKCKGPSRSFSSLPRPDGAWVGSIEGVPGPGSRDTYSETWGTLVFTVTTCDLVFSSVKRDYFSRARD